MKILVTDPVADEAMDMLREKHEVAFDNLTGSELAAEIGPYHGLMVRSGTQVTREVIEAADNLMVIGRAGIGVDNIDLEAASERDVKVVNSPTGATPSVAELTIAHMLALARHLPRADRTMKAGEWAKKQLKGTELKGKTLGLVGCGNIGSLVAEYAQALGMTVVGYDPYICEEDLADAGIGKMDLDGVLGEADYVSLHVPHVESTHHIIDAAALQAMKDTACLVNCARGGVVDEDALYEALKNGDIAGAALDVYENEPPGETRLAELDNMVMTPHLGAATREGQIRAGTVCAEQMLLALDGETPEFWVNREK
ncbi:MAG: hydroxyacid dehydrogenase [Thermoplasmatota archaeon]